MDTVHGESEWGPHLTWLTQSTQISLTQTFGSHTRESSHIHSTVCSKQSIALYHITLWTKQRTLQEVYKVKILPSIKTYVPGTWHEHMEHIEAHHSGMSHHLVLPTYLIPKPHRAIDHHSTGSHNHYTSTEPSSSFRKNFTIPVNQLFGNWKRLFFKVMDLMCVKAKVL